MSAIDGRWFVYLFASVASDLQPLRSDRVRSEGCGAFVAYEHDGCTTLLISMQNDPKGSIPKSIINVVGPRMAGQWCERFVKHCEKAPPVRNSL